MPMNMEEVRFTGVIPTRLINTDSIYLQMKYQPSSLTLGIRQHELVLRGKMFQNQLSLLTTASFHPKPISSMSRTSLATIR